MNNEEKRFNKFWDDTRKELIVKEDSHDFIKRNKEDEEKSYYDIIFDNQMDHPVETLEKVFDIFDK